jgi:DNA-binding MarR family transcriptional regulator
MEFDKLVHQPTRLRIFAYLYQHGETSFSALKDDLDITEGNLSSHIQKIEDAGAVRVEKEFVDRKPRTTYQLTGEGREKFEEHIGTLESLIQGLGE